MADSHGDSPNHSRFGAPTTRRYPVAEKKTIAPGLSPFRQFVITGTQFVGDFVDTCDLVCIVLLNQPVPEDGTEIETIVQVLGLDEYVRIE